MSLDDDDEMGLEGVLEGIAVLQAVEQDAVAFGSGYMQVTRDADGDYHYRRLDPTLVTMLKRPNDDPASETEREDTERGSVL